MSRLRSHPERHAVSRIGWLRAAVLGANDGIVSTASLIVGVAASGAGKANILVAGMAALVAGAMSMAAGEYVSVSSQADTENADLARERGELAVQPVLEHQELADIYALHRSAQLRWDFISSENSTGFHSPQEAARVLADSIDMARQAQIKAIELLNSKQAGGQAAAPVQLVSNSN